MFETVQSDLNLFVIYMIRSLIENVAGLYVERWLGSPWIAKYERSYTRNLHEKRFHKRIFTRGCH